MYLQIQWTHSHEAGCSVQDDAVSTAEHACLWTYSKATLSAVTSYSELHLPIPLKQCDREPLVYTTLFVLRSRGEKKRKNNMPPQQAGSALKKQLQKAGEKTVIAQLTVRYPIHLSLAVTSHEEVQSIICCHPYLLVHCKKCFSACKNPFSCTHVKIQMLYLLLHCIYNSDSILICWIRKAH